MSKTPPRAAIDEVSVRVHLEAAIDALAQRFHVLRTSDQAARLEHQQLERHALDIAMTAQQQAIEKAQVALERRLDESKEALEHRLDGLNNLRSNFATIAQLEIVTNRVMDLTSRTDKIEARTDGRAGGLRDYIGWIVAAAAVASSVVTFALR